ncbi:hypothetical protein [Deinococcus misasensis]|uniref:hypothetical protein n=1 Tax=Deinococcus misasensis TaxID=392413 RepID=UPI00055690AD|nr:hypothetical protein [Deinococcus misasensis]
MSVRIQCLHHLLQESSFDPWESVSSILKARGPRANRLQQHILETKKMYWALIGQITPINTPPDELPEMLLWEIEQVQCLSEDVLDSPLLYCGREMTVEALVRLSARHSVWHAGQVALTRMD